MASALGNAASSPGRSRLNLRYVDFHTITHGKTIAPTSVDFELHRVVLELYPRVADARPADPFYSRPRARELRLDAVQLPLFDKGERRGIAVDRVRERYGFHAVHLGSTISRKRRAR